VAALTSGLLITEVYGHNPLIEGTKQYVVPLFQRSYSWDRKEWEVLWKDLIELYEMENPRTHFMGSIVTMPGVSVPEGVPK
jgi:uncharacterized protein with ParB-like and HNH nuclease domain